jgi:hypothetical protein
LFVTNPQVIDEAQLAAQIDAGRLPVVQFLNATAFNPAIFAHLNTCCQRFGAKLTVRFLGFYNVELDLQILSQLPAVRSLIIDVFTAKNIEYIGQLEHLEELGLGVFKGNYPKILEETGIQRIQKLILIDTRRNNVDLAPLEHFSHLKELVLCAHARNIDVLANLAAIQILKLNKIKKSVRLPWIHSMTGLRDLTILLGGRTDIDEVRNEQLERLRVDRIRGLERVNLGAFPSVTKFHMEDQLQIEELDLAPLHSTLRSMTIWNCKNFQFLRGLEKMSALEFLWVGQTKVNPEAIIPELPACLREVTFAGYGKKRDAALKALLQEKGFAPAGYVG